MQSLAPPTLDDLRQQDAENREKLMRQIVMRLGRGNVRLQTGAYLTAEQLRKDREFVLKLVIEE